MGNKFKVGDLLRCIEPSRELTLGGIYRVTRLSRSAGVHFVDVEGQDLEYWESRFELAAIIAVPPVPPPAKLPSAPDAVRSIAQSILALSYRDMMRLEAYLGLLYAQDVLKACENIERDTE